jgi:hypothetical protein
VADRKSYEQVAVQGPETETILVTGLVRAVGNLVLLSGLTEDNQEVIFVCERRYVSDILTDIETGLEPESLVPVYMITTPPSAGIKTP